MKLKEKNSFAVVPSDLLENVVRKMKLNVRALHLKIVLTVDGEE